PQRDGERRYDNDRGPRRDGDRYDRGERGDRGQRAYPGRAGRPERAGRDREEERPPRVGAIPLTQAEYLEAPEIPEEVTYNQLDRTVRARLRTLSKDNAEDVGRHLIMAGNLLDIDPELAYRHAQVAAARGGRVDVVREAAALTAYATGRYAEALREFRTVRRLGGSNEHLPLMADCERGLGRPERALAIAQEPEARTLDKMGRIELEIVIAGARLDMGDADAARLILSRLETADAELRARIDHAMVDVLRALGRDEEADALEAAIPEPVEEVEEEDVVLYDTAELPDPDADEDADEDADDER
ncbi:hypothetical protein QQX10_12470, partial [Demequina sp. SYSU T00039]|nr:hypothetical protein [Demequina sp. SYSU T00039-1]MDN4488981.1 hypothetical protein [Demequina sp. SYSU T00039]